MLFKYKNNKLETLPYYSCADFGKKEKDLENLLAEQLREIYIEDAQLMTIFQERQRQPEPDICALDKNGNLIIFELKRGNVNEDTTIQIMRYAQKYGRKSYWELNRIYKTYLSKQNKENMQCENGELKEAHAAAFDLEIPLNEEEFNRSQKLIIVGSAADASLVSAVDYWRSKNLDIDFLPYRFYEIAGETYFEFFAKPYDVHFNPKEKKGILFDTNRTYDENAIWDMFAQSKVSAYGNAARYADNFNKGDYVLYYHRWCGVVGAGIVEDIKTSDGDELKQERYRKVRLLTPMIESEDEIKSISASELKSLLNKNFYFASTIKTPYLSKDEAEMIIEELKKKYN